jgi:hypothetical protein
LLGRRREFAELAESLEDESTLLAHLRRSGRPWHEVEVSPRVPGPARRLVGVRRLDAIHAGVGPRDRADRLDEGEHPPGQQQRPTYLTPLGEITEG